MRLSDLEYVILGILAKFGPATPYAVRKHFQGSPTHYFSSSTGSIYPALARLEGEGLVARRADTRGRQARSIYSVGRAGRRALEGWLKPPLDDHALAVPYDPIRTRLYFLACLPARSRRRFLDGVIDDLEARLPQVRAYVDSFPAEGDTRISHLAARGSLTAARAQLRWLRRVRRGLGPGSRARTP